MTSNSVKIAAALLAAAFLSAPPQPPATAQTKAPAKAPEFMFVQTAKDIAYKDGVLTLQDVSPMTVFFSSAADCGPRAQRSLLEKMGRG